MASTSHHRQRREMATRSVSAGCLQQRNNYQCITKQNNYHYWIIQCSQYTFTYTNIYSHILHIHWIIVYLIVTYVSSAAALRWDNSCCNNTSSVWFCCLMSSSSSNIRHWTTTHIRSHSIELNEWYQMHYLEKFFNIIDKQQYIWIKKQLQCSFMSETGTSNFTYIIN